MFKAANSLWGDAPMKSNHINTKYKYTGDYTKSHARIGSLSRIISW